MATLLTLIIMTLFCAVLLALLIVRGRSGPASARSVEKMVSIEELRSIGVLSVFKAVTKEIVTAKDHSLGSLGKRYLEWLVTSRKMAMIFAFDIDFQYDLRDPAFQIAESAPGRFTLQMPPCNYAVHIRDVTFYDEQAGKLLPMIVPDVINNMLGGGFNEADRNRLLEEARMEAEKVARNLSLRLSSEAQTSARQTMEMLAKSFGAESVEVTFAPAQPSPAAAPAAAKGE